MQVGVAAEERAEGVASEHSSGRGYKCSETVRRVYTRR